jgi:D-amino-acid dehydrogenase
VKTIVLGAGVIGTTTAYYLARAGHEVHLVERRSDVACETSAGNGSVMHASLCEPWSRPGMPKNVWKWLGKEDAPLLVRYGAIPGMWRWGLDFIRNCNRKDFLRNTRANLGIASRSLDCVAAIVAETGISYDRRTNGTMKVYSSQQGLDEAAEEAEVVRPYGLAVEIVDSRRAIEIEPALAKRGEKMAGAVYFAKDEHGDCQKFTRGLAEHLKKMGVTIHTDTEVRRLRRDGNRIGSVETSKGTLTADNFVVAMGSYSPGLVAPLGIRLPIYPVKGVTVTVPGENWPERPKLPVIDEAKIFGLVPLGDRLRCSGSAEFTGFDAVPSRTRCQALVDNVIAGFPDFARCYDPDTAVFWAGLRPMTPTGTPVIGRSPIANLFFNCGHNHLGWTLSCGSSDVVAKIVAGKDPGLDLDRLQLDRR